MAEQLSDIWQDPAEAIGELLLDKPLGEMSPALAQIPLLSIAIAAYKSKGAVSDYVLARKVQRFYTAWDKLDMAERRKIYQKFQKKPRAFTEKLLFIIAQQEDLAKCELLGVLTTSYLGGNLKRSDYIDLTETVAHVSLGDLLRLPVLLGQSLIFPQRVIGERYAALFVARGLIAAELHLPAEQRATDEQFYRITKLGSIFAEHVGSSNLHA